MSGPFVFTPTNITTGLPTQYPLKYVSQYDPYAALPQNSPFIPSPSLFPGTPSPYSHTIPLPSSPRLSAAQPLTPTLYPTSPWTAGFPSPGSLGGIGGIPESQPPPSQYGYPASIYNIYQQAPPPPPRHVQLHPWLDGMNTRSDLWLDISMGIFSPQRVVDSMGTRVPLTMPQLQAPATDPHVFGMRLICESMPMWPLEISQPQRALCVGDVMNWVYKAMQLRITYDDWYKLTEAERREVAKAYLRRCRALGPDLSQAERSQGVKRVDYLLGKVLFRGLVIDHYAGVLRMVFQ